MISQVFILFALLITISNALFTGPFIHKAFKPVVESRARILNGENSRGTFIVALHHQNNEDMEQEFLDVSTPKSDKYGKHLTLDEMKSKYSPSLKNSQKVINFFNSFTNSQVEMNAIGDMIKVTASLSSINEIMKTKVSVHSNDKNHRILRAEQSFYIPIELHSIISFVSLNAPITVKPEKDALISLDTQGYYNVTATGGNTNVLLRFQTFCSDGELNNQSPPCATQNDSIFTVIVVPYVLKKDPSNDLKIVAILAETDPYIYPVFNNKEIYCFSKTTEQECDGIIAGSDCVCVLSISPLPKYTQLRATIEVKYGDASTNNVMVGQTNMFCLTDVATPEFLSKLYNMPRSITARHGSNQSVAEFYGEFYSNSDLEVFFELTGLPNASIPVSNVYGDLTNNQANPGGEAQLDVEYIMALAPNATTYFYSMSDLNPYDPINEGFINYLWVVGNQTNPPLVHSLSYGDIEANIFNASNPGSIEYGTACDTLFMAMGLRGLSVLFSSGDDGIGNSIMREDPEYACSKAWPSWPASSPYVTTIGATVLTDRYLPACNANYAYSYRLGNKTYYPSMPQDTQIHVECTGTAETVCSSALGGVITSGGGFSNVYSQPIWQKKLVDNYLSMSNKIPPNDYFNSFGRGYPDISTYGSNYLIYLNGKLSRESGTSASAPVFAAMVTLWNDMRLAYNMPPLGFIAPFLYSIGENTPEAFNDIVTGNNACGVGSSVDIITCCEYSFEAAPGWDGSTGLGSPNFDVISNIVINANTFFPTDGAYPDGSNTQTSNDNNDNDNDNDNSIAIVALVFSIISIVFMSFLSYIIYAKKNEESLRSSLIERSNSNKI